MIRRILLLSVMLLFSGALQSWAAPKKEYLIAVLPQRPAVAMHANWRPFLDKLEKESGIAFKLKLYETMGQFEDDVKRGEGDFIFTTPPQVVLAQKGKGYIPLVRGNKKIAGVLFTKKDSGINKIGDLDNQEVAFVGSRNV